MAALSLPVAIQFLLQRHCYLDYTPFAPSAPLATDQVHKIFVPGRHFDMIDLGFDAAGYITAMLLVLLIVAWVHHVTRPIGAHARR